MHDGKRQILDYIFNMKVHFLFCFLTKGSPRFYYRNTYMYYMKLYYLPEKYYLTFNKPKYSQIFVSKEVCTMFEVVYHETFYHQQGNHTKIFQE